MIGIGTNGMYRLFNFNLVQLKPASTPAAGISANIATGTPQILSSKFYFFDTGAKRALEGHLQVPIVARTFAYGRAFEHFIICECMRLNSYGRKDFRFSFLKTKTDLEIDLIVQRPGAKQVCIEIKSTGAVDETHAKVLNSFRADFPDAEFYIFSNDPRPKKFGTITALPWMDGFKEIGLT